MAAGSKKPNERADLAIPESHRNRVAEFARFVRGVAGDRGASPPDPEGFSDEMGHRRPVDAPFLAWRNGRHDCAPAPRDAHLDVVVWTHLAGARVDVPEVLRAHRPGAGGFGALVEQSSVRSIEVWSETELGALHALSWIALREGSPEIAGAVLDAARWHIAHMQPDNATNHPWAAHVFALLEAVDGSIEAGLYAQTLVHNCQVTLGKPDRLSAQILEDSAAWVDHALR